MTHNEHKGHHMLAVDLPSHWVIARPDPAQVQGLAQSLRVHPVIAAVLINRGCQTVDDAERFLHPDWPHLDDPFKLPQAEAAVDRLVRACKAKEKVLVFGDYDVDGVTSTAIWRHTLTSLGARVVPVVPHRHEHGYGIRTEDVRMAVDRGVTLIVTCDCGTHAIEPAHAAREAGVDLIITDHHEPGGELPDAVAVVNPHLPDSAYKFRHLAGAGVSFRLCEALVMGMGIPVHNFRRRMLDLAALGTIADAMPLREDNRLFARLGLPAIQNTSRPGLRALLELIRATGEVTVRTLQFALAPRINAVGRMSHAQRALELMITDDPEQAARLAQHLDQCNNTRRAEQLRMEQQALKMLESQPVDELPLLMLAHPDWDGGVIGIVASRLLDRFGRPAIMVTRGQADNTWRGSARSTSNFDMVAALRQCRSLLEDFGGHTQAAGFTILEEQIPALRDRLVGIAREMLGTQPPEPSLEIDAEVMPGDINGDLVDQLHLLEPCGEDNPVPLFMVRNAVIRDCRRCVNSDKHWKVALETPDGSKHDAIGFNMGDQQDNCRQGDRIHVVFHPEWNTYNGRRSLQLQLRDVCAAE